MTTKSVEQMVADNIRILSAAMVEKAKSGHPGGAMGGAEFMQVLFGEYMRYNPENPEWPFRDRFFLDPGHMSPLLYSTLTMAGYMQIDDLKEFRQWGSITPGHPELDVKHGVENTSGPLGLGHTFAVGAAIAERIFADRFGEWLSHKTYVYISDGGIQEEISQGAGRIAGHLGLSNLVMFYDANSIQLSTTVNEVTSEDTAKKYEAWGWNVLTIDGNDVNEIRKALDNANEQTDKPTLIIGKTVMGKGAVGENGESFENMVSTHGQPLSAAGASINKTIENLGGDAENPFVIFDEVKTYFAKRIEENKAYYTEHAAKEKAWRNDNPELSEKLTTWLSGKAPGIPFENIELKNDIATRVASGKTLAYISDYADNVVVSSADLANSDKTEEFLKKSKALAKGDFSGGFLHAGVSELTMGALSVGMALHGGIIPVCATFFVFSDYMKPVIRIAALMELPVVFVYTHDSFRVGEDGPTHQPIEHEAQLRLLEQYNNHSGIRALTALRPADGPETVVSWKMIMEEYRNRPTALILSRQNIKTLPEVEGKTAYQRALQAERGAYIAWESNSSSEINMVLLGSGSEVSTLIEVGKLLEKENICSRVVSMISVGKFKNRAEKFRYDMLPLRVPVFALTSSVESVFSPIKKNVIYTYAMRSFGHSAPANVLDEKFGYVPENIVKEVKTFLNKRNAENKKLNL